MLMFQRRTCAEMQTPSLEDANNANNLEED
jgi:hypothetical protein